MVEKKKRTLEELINAVLEMDKEKVSQVAKRILETDIDPVEAITSGLSKGMEIAGDKFEKGEYFIPELLMCAGAMKAGVDIFKPHIKVHKLEKSAIMGVIGVMRGDVHDLGKDLVKTMLEAAGFEICDLGKNVPLTKFIDEAEKANAKLICMSTLLSMSMNGMGKVINMLEKRRIRSKYKVLIGGGSVSQSFAEEIGADGYAENASSAVKVAKNLVR